MDEISTRFTMSKLIEITSVQITEDLRKTINDSMSRRRQTIKRRPSELVDRENSESAKGMTKSEASFSKGHI